MGTGEEESYYNTVEPRVVRADLATKVLCHDPADVCMDQGHHDVTTLESPSLNSETFDSGDQSRQSPSMRGKLQGSRPNCLECDRLAFGELDFCALCLTMEVKKWQIESTVGEVQNRWDNNKQSRIAKHINYQPLSSDEMHELRSLLHNTHSFCVENQVSMRIVQSMLARHGRESHNPLIRQYCLKNGDHYASGRHGTPQRTKDSLEELERSAFTHSTWPQIRDYENRGHTGHFKWNTHQLPQNRRFDRTAPIGIARSPLFGVQSPSPVGYTIDPQKKPTFVGKWSVGVENEHKQELFPCKLHSKAGNSASKRKLGHESHRNENDRDEITPSRMTSEASGEVEEWQECSPADRHRNILKEFSSKPDEMWVTVVLEEILQMEMAARPASLLEVSFAVKDELEKQLMEEIVYGDADEGRPIQIPLLRALNHAIWIETG